VGKANGSRECAPDDRLRVPTIPDGDLGKMVGTLRFAHPTISAPLRKRFAFVAGNDDRNHFPVFTLVQSRLMTRWVAGSRAWMTNSFFCVASSG
jgi:hypothetical protein